MNPAHDIVRVTFDRLANGGKFEYYITVSALDYIMGLASDHFYSKTIDGKTGETFVVGELILKKLDMIEHLVEAIAVPTRLNLE